MRRRTTADLQPLKRKDRVLFRATAPTALNGIDTQRYDRCWVLRGHLLLSFLYSAYERFAAGETFECLASSGAVLVLG